MVRVGVLLREMGEPARARVGALGVCGATDGRAMRSGAEQRRGAWYTRSVVPRRAGQRVEWGATTMAQGSGGGPVVSAVFKTVGCSLLQRQVRFLPLPH